MKPKAAGAFLTKRALIDKANTTMVVAAGIAAFLVVFSLVSAKSFVSQLMYQNRVISAKKETLNRIEKNLDARDSLVKSYKTFVNSPTNLIGGNAAALDDRGGDNYKIVLDALPSKYDFPALTASMEKLVIAQGMKLKNVNGDDDEVAQAGQKSSAAPKQVPLDFQITVEGSYAQLTGLVDTFEKSIRPIKIVGVTISSGDEGLKAEMSVETYYQSEKKLELTEKVVK